MPFTYTITEAANKYGMNDMGASVRSALQQNAIIGTYNEPTISADGLVATINMTSSGGFLGTIKALVTSSTSANVTSVTLSKNGENVVHASGSLSVNNSNLGLVGDTAYILSGADTIHGNSFNNELKGYRGNDAINGNGGTDTVLLDGLSSQYRVTKSSSAITTVGPDGTDSLFNIERIKFSDKAIAFDINGNAGQAYRLYQAAFDRKPDAAGLGAQINGLDSGMSLQQISQNFINSAEFQSKYGANVSNDAFAAQLYANVLHRAPDAPGLAVQVNALNAGLSRAQLLINFSEGQENYGATLVGIQNGIEFAPVA